MCLHVCVSAYMWCLGMHTREGMCECAVLCTWNVCSCDSACMCVPSVGMQAEKAENVLSVHLSPHLELLLEV